MANNVLFSKNAINDVELVCTDGILWFSKHLLYTCCTELRVQMLDTGCIQVQVQNACTLAVLQVLHHISNMHDSKRHDTHIYCEAYIVCNKWGYASGSDNFARAIAQIPTLLSLRLLREYEDDEYMDAVSNFVNQYDIDENNNWQQLPDDERMGMVSDICNVYRRQQQDLNRLTRFSRELIKHRVVLGGRDGLSVKIDELQSIYLRDMQLTTLSSTSKKRKHATGGEPVAC